MDYIKNLNFRTDMADEAHSLWQGRAGDKASLPGVRFSSRAFHGLELTEIEILDLEGEKALGKCRGHYYSLSLPEFFDRGSLDFENIVTALSELIGLCSGSVPDNVLVAALGNPDVTPDALGNLAASSLLVTRHLDRNEFPQFASLSLSRPGVLGTSGIESASQIKALSELVNPGLIIVIDALAGCDVQKLCRCVQVSNAGISPGSGVGNDRQNLSRDSLGVPVLSIGIPTVIDAQHFAGDEFSGMFVTPRNIDSLVRSGGRIIGYAINLAVHHGLTLSDIDSLLG